MIHTHGRQLCWSSICLPSEKGSTLKEILCSVPSENKKQKKKKKKKKKKKIRKYVCSKRKEFAPKGSKLFSFRVDILSLFRRYLVYMKKNRKSQKLSTLYIACEPSCACNVENIKVTKTSKQTSKTITVFTLNAQTTFKVLTILALNSKRALCLHFDESEYCLTRLHSNSCKQC